MEIRPLNTGAPGKPRGISTKGFWNRLLPPKLGPATPGAIAGVVGSWIGAEIDRWCSGKLSSSTIKDNCNIGLCICAACSVYQDCWSDLGIWQHRLGVIVAVVIGIWSGPFGVLAGLAIPTICVTKALWKFEECIAQFRVFGEGPLCTNPSYASDLGD